MQPVFQKIETNINYSFYVEHEKSRFFTNPLQFHPEIEILYVIQGSGTLIVGDSVTNFGSGELVMIGQNVPHLWHSDEKYLQENSNLFSDRIYILFKTEIFGEQFWQLPELKSILKLIQFSQRGIKLTGTTHKKVTLLMRSISKSNGINRITLLLSILEIIASQKKYQFLTSPIVQNSINERDSERLNKVYKYVINNYHQDITLKNAASVANLSIPSFCRYFKQRTGKTFIQLLNEIRISYACRYLLEKDIPIEKICYICGYTNVSYFIKQFKTITKYTPLSYKQKWL
jgi:AraC-like DNA-binding protein